MKKLLALLVITVLIFSAPIALAEEGSSDGGESSDSGGGDSSSSEDSSGDESAPSEPPADEPPQEEPPQDDTLDDSDDESSDTSETGEDQSSDEEEESETPDSGDEESSDDSGSSEPPTDEPPTDEPPTDEGPHIPEGCWQETDEFGNIRVICEGDEGPSCEPVTDETVEACRASGGEPYFSGYSGGCSIMTCQYWEDDGPSFFQPTHPGMCPSHEERNDVYEKCKMNNMQAIERRASDGCIVVECVPGDFDQMCPSHEDLERHKEDCNMRGGKVIPFVDRNGCDIVDCSFSRDGPEQCKDIGKDTIDKCHMDGGEMIIREDGEGCIYYAKCIRRGDDRDMRYERINEVPDGSKLLSIALKLESIKIEFDKLAAKTNDIANYYANRGNSEEEARFRRVSGMFAGATTRVDEIKLKMRDNMDTMTVEDMSEVRHDIRYLKDVFMKDILYVMLASDVSEFTGPAETDKERFMRGDDDEELEGCGRDGGCFDAAVRFCKPTKFFPEDEPGEEGPPGKVVIEVVGLEGENCIIKGSMVVEQLGLPMDMKCKYPNYAMGMRGPEDLLPYCEGSFAEMARQKMNDEVRIRGNHKPYTPDEPNDRPRFEEPMFEEPIFER